MARHPLALAARAAAAVPLAAALLAASAAVAPAGAVAAPGPETVPAGEAVPSVPVTVPAGEAVPSVPATVPPGEAAVVAGAQAEPATRVLPADERMSPDPAADEPEEPPGPDAAAECMPDRGYRPPVAAPVTDPFRPPAHPFGPGNRGLEYAPPPGTPVRAIGSGTVVFAGPVAGELHVTVRHADGLRSTYSYLGQRAVAADEPVTRGQVVGWAGPRLHLGVRCGTAYLDPARLFGGRWRARLVPDRRFPGPPAPFAASRSPPTRARRSAGRSAQISGSHPGRRDH